MGSIASIPEFEEGVRAMATLTPAQAEFFAEPNYPVLTTLRADGTPHNTVVWVDWDEEKGLSFNTAVGRAKHRHLERNPHLALTVVKEPYRWISVTGRGQLVTEGADAQIDHLAKKYLGQERYPWRAEGEVRVTVRVEIDKVEDFSFGS
jgi:PPOX class probable F420-dependent enzyme